MRSMVVRLLPALALSALPAVLALGEVVPGRTGALTPPLAFAATLWAVPASRPARSVALTPRTIVWAAFALQLVVAPLLLVALGPVEWVFPVEQTWGAIQASALLTALSFPCWALGIALVARRLPDGPERRTWPPVPRRLMAAFAVLGIAGTALLLMQAGASPVRTDGSADGALNVLRLMLRPFLAAVGIALLSNAVLAWSRGDATPQHVRDRLLVCGVLVLLSYGSLDWRRAPLLAVLLGLLAACALILGRPGPKGLLGLLGLGAAGFFLVRVLRTPDASLAMLFSGTGSPTSPLGALNTEVQSYGGGLQMTAFLLDHIDVVGYLGGLGQLHTALAPIPVLGAGARDETPAALFNALFLNRDDQTLPLVGQFFLDLGVPGVVIGFLVVGALTELLDRAFLRSGTIVQAAVWATPAAWLAFSLGAGTTGLYQFLIYFSLPAYVLLLVLGRRAAPAGPRRQKERPMSSLATD